MTTISIHRDKRGRWLATSDNPKMPRICRTVPVFDVSENDMYLSFTDVKREVERCNPGNKVVIQ